MPSSDPDPFEVGRRYAKMKAAREDWVRACEEMQRALALLRNLNLTHASTDGVLALRNARVREAETRKEYLATVELYADAVLRGVD
jgi:hypothetical protein